MLSKLFSLSKPWFTHLWNEDNKWLMWLEVCWDYYMLHVIKHVKVPSTRQLLTLCAFSPNNWTMKFKNSWASHGTATLWTANFDLHPKSYEWWPDQIIMFTLWWESRLRILLSSGNHTLKIVTETFLVIQWLDSPLPMQGTQVQSLVRKLYPTCLNQDLA